MGTDYKELSRQSFDRDAITYDQSGMYATVRSRYSRVVEEILKYEFSTCLDLGCGTGALLSMISSMRPKATLFGVDLSNEMIKVARERLPVDTSLVVGDAESLPFDDNTFGLVACTFSFHHYPRPKVALAEMKRVLAPGGKFIIADLWAAALLRAIMNLMLPFCGNGDVHIYSENEIIDLALSVGLLAVKWTCLGSNGFLFVGSKEQ